MSDTQDAPAGGEQQVAALREALEKIAEPDQDGLRAALRTGEPTRIIEAVTALLNRGRDLALAALSPARAPIEPAAPEECGVLTFKPGHTSWHYSRDTGRMYHEPYAAPAHEPYAAPAQEKKPPRTGHTFHDCDPLVEDAIRGGLCGRCGKPRSAHAGAAEEGR